MIGWPAIGYGAALTAVAALLALLATGARRRPVLAAAVLAGAVAPVAWNAILRATHAGEFFTDLPLAVLPASWQDTGSGVFALAAVTLTLGAGPARRDSAGQLALRALTVGLAAFAVDVYLY